MPAAFEMGNVMTSRQGVPPGTESPQLISKLQDAGLTGGSREGKIIPNRENDCVGFSRPDCCYLHASV